MARDPDPVSVAEAERDHIASLIDAHRRSCTCRGDDPTLLAHLDRAQRQVDMLQPAAEQDALFDMPP